MIPFLKKLEELDNKKIALVVIVAVALLYVDFNYLLKAQSANVKTLTTKVVKLKKDLDKLNKDIKNMQDLKSKQSATKNVLLKAKKIMQEGEAATLLQEISNLANKHEVKILQIKPFKEARLPHDKIQPIGKFIPLFVTIEAQAEYHNFGKFINDLENARFFIAVHEFKIMSQSTDYFKQKINLVLRTYVKR